MIAEVMGPHWELTSDEVERLSYRFARVEQKWGGFLDKYAPEFALLGCAGMIIYPRMKKDKELRKGKHVEAEVVEDATDRAVA